MIERSAYATVVQVTVFSFDISTVTLEPEDDSAGKVSLRAT